MILGRMNSSLSCRTPRIRLPDWLAWAVLALVAAVAATTFRDYGLGWDDYTHSQYGDLLLSFYASGFRDTRALSFVNLYLYGGGFDMAAALAAKILPFDLFETRRLMGAAVGLVGLVATWRIARRIGGPPAGLLALLLCATCPLYYGHMFINPKDGPFAAAMAVFLLGLVRLIDEYPRPKAATLVIVALGFGLSVGSRVMAGFGAIAAMLSVAMIVALQAHGHGWSEAVSNARRFFVAVIPAAILAYATMALVWPWSVANPINPLRAIEIFSHFFEKPWQELYGGERLTPLEMPRSYVPVLLGLQLPEVFLMLAGMGTAGALMIASGYSSRPKQARAAYLAVALSALLPIAVAVATRPAMYNGLRHFVFVLPPFAVLGGLAGAWLIERAATYGRAALAAGVVLLTVGIALPVAEMVRLHPYQYVSFNRLAGGVQGAQPRYMLDYWGLAFKQAGGLARVLASRGERPPEGRKWIVGVCGPHPPAQVALGDDFEPTWNPAGADFALMLGTFYCAQLDAPVFAEVVRDGVVFARAYDIRGRTVTDLFTLPPVQ
jgi:hypothetical protein